MENKYKEIYNELKKEYADTLECKDSQKFIDEFKAVVRSKIKQIHENLDKKKVEITNLAIEAYDKQSKQDEDPKQEEIKKKLLNKNKKKKKLTPKVLKAELRDLSKI